MNINPYEVLGVSEKDSLEHIENVYKNFLLVLHPDKANTPEARSLNMRQEDKLQYLQLVRTAYNTITTARRETKYPDYKIDYEINPDSKINMHGDFTAEDAKDFNSKKFNEEFNKSQERDKKAGITDAFGRGYGEFDTGKKFSDTGKLTMPTYSGDIDTEPSKVFHRPDMKDNRLIEYLPESNPFAAVGMEYQELGLANVSDFSMTTSGKGSLGGVDLMSAYGQNYEPWSKTVERDSKLSAKFKDEGNVTQRMAQLEVERGGIYNLPIDKKLMDAERARNFAAEQQEKMRMSQETHRDEYYTELNKGRLKDILQPRTTYLKKS